MGIPIKTQEQVRDEILATWRNLDDQVDVSADSDNFIRASGFGSATEGLYQYAAWAVNQFFPDTADIEYLRRFASVRGISQLAASSAIGTINFTGTPGAGIPAGTLVQTADGNQYQTTAIGTISGAGTAAITASAVSAGIVGNQIDNMPGTLQAAPAGIDAAAILVQMRGGTEAESPAALLVKVLDRLRQPPAGGNKFDYPRWAREVPGVTAAYCYPTRRGIGTGDVAILSNSQPPSDALREAVTAYIADRVSVEVDFMVLSPQMILVPISATLELAAGIQLADVTTKITAALSDYFTTLRPGDTVRRTRIQTIIGDITGVIDYSLVSPAQNITTTVDATHVEMPALGALSIGL